MEVCEAEPFLMIAEATSCAESPPCTQMLCYEHVQCFLASTLSPIVAGCRTPERELFCVCPSFPPQFPSLSAPFRKIGTTHSTISSVDPSETTVVVPQSGGMNGLHIALIVIGVILFILLLAVAAFFVTKAIRNRRRNHGEYRPQFEELHHAKDLPYLQPPAVEGLI